MDRTFKRHFSSLNRIREKSDNSQSVNYAASRLSSFPLYPGKGPIFKATLNPFSLQKWPHIKYPITPSTYWGWTVVQTQPKISKKAPFNCATSRADAVRQWCEWILHYGDADGPPQNQDPKVRQVSHSSAIAAPVSLLKVRNDPVAFARGLSTVGFGENRSKGEVYAKRLTSFSMTDYDY